LATSEISGKQHKKVTHSLPLFTERNTSVDKEARRGDPDTENGPANLFANPPLRRQPMLLLYFNDAF